MSLLLQLLRFTLGNGGVEQRQMHRKIRIFVDDIHEYVTNGLRDGKFLPALADECLSFGFAWLYFTANELP